MFAHVQQRVAKRVTNSKERATTMASQLSILYSARYADLRSRHAARRRRNLAARFAAIAIAVVLAVLIVYGERWMLSQESAVPNELVVATYMVDAVYGDAADASNACTDEAVSQQNKANTL